MKLNKTITLDNNKLKAYIVYSKYKTIVVMAQNPSDVHVKVDALGIEDYKLMSDKSLDILT